MANPLIDKILIKENINHLSFLILEGINVNSLSQLFQQELVGDKDYNDLSDEEKEKLKSHVTKRKEEIKSLVDSITENPTEQAFIYTMLMKEDQRFPEDFDGVKSTIEAFAKVKNSGNFSGSKNIMDYKTFQDLHKAVYEFKAEHGKRKHESEFDIGSKVAETNMFTVYELVDSDFKAFSKFINDNSIAWCVKDKSYWDDYEPPYYYWEKDSKPFALLNFNSNEFLDIHDSEIEQSDEIIEMVSELEAYGLLDSYEIPIQLYKNKDLPKNELFVEVFGGELDENGVISHRGSVESSELSHFIINEKLIIKFKTVNGDFDCNTCDLITLIGCPQIVGRHFNCSYNDLTSLKGAPKKVGGNFKCDHNNYNIYNNNNNNNQFSLDGAPKLVGGDFDCDHNNLTSLNGAPKTVDGNFNCFRNNLTSLIGAPKKVGAFECSQNKLSSLVGAPQTVDGNFLCVDNNLTSLSGAPKLVSGDFYCYDNKKNFTVDDVKDVSNVKGTIIINSKDVNYG